MLGDQVSHQGAHHAHGTADRRRGHRGGGLTPIRAAVALSVFMFGMLAGADIAARVMPPVQDDGGAYLLHLLPSSWHPPSPELAVEVEARAQFRP